MQSTRVASELNKQQNAFQQLQTPTVVTPMGPYSPRQKKCRGQSQMQFHPDPGPCCCCCGSSLYEARPQHASVACTSRAEPNRQRELRANNHHTTEETEKGIRSRSARSRSRSRSRARARAVVAAGRRVREQLCVKERFRLRAAGSTSGSHAR